MLTTEIFLYNEIDGVEEDICVDVEFEGHYVPYRAATRWEPAEGGNVEDINFFFLEDFVFNGVKYEAGMSLYECEELWDYMEESIRYLEERAEEMIIEYETDDDDYDMYI